MRRTITIAAYRRPDYLEQVLRSLRQALLACPEYHPYRIVIGIDPGADCQSDIETAAARMKFSYRHVEVITWPEHLGVNEHPRRLLQYVFTEIYSMFNVHIEDDTVLSPDALRLAVWFHDRSISDVIGERNVLGVSLHNPSRDYDHTDRVYHTDSFGVWGWGCTEWSWRKWLSPLWNHKRNFPIGWDWSISATMQKYRLKCLAPSLSRVHNIGRERGQYQTPEGHDRDFAGQVWAREQDMQLVSQFKIED